MCIGTLLFENGCCGIPSGLMIAEEKTVILLFLNADFLLIVSLNLASFKDPKLIEVSPQRGPQAGGTTLTIKGRKLLTGRVTDISVLLGNVPCSL